MCKKKLNVLLTMDIAFNVKSWSKTKRVSQVEETSLATDNSLLKKPLPTVTSIFQINQNHFHQTCKGTILL